MNALAEPKKQKPFAETDTFIVDVKFRQNSTWQGIVRWKETGKEVHFRSALELLKIMDNALEQKYGPAE